MSQKRYVQVGMGARAEMYVEAITKKYRDTSQLVALCDLNPGRVALYKRRLIEQGYGEIAGYQAEAFDRMLAVHKPHTVIVTTRDCFHDEYICRAMEAGCDVITEKPLTVDAKKCQRIVDSVRRTGRDLRVTFNYRYSPPRSQVKQLLMEGVIGRILSVDFEWNLDLRHGADYYRRWHRNKVNSGGLLVHKATHHFDLVNWWLSSTPRSVIASGRRAFYLPETAERLGLRSRTERCHTCPHKADGSCRFALDLAGNPKLRELYLEQENFDGYYRDRCVFSPEIDIEDSMTLVVEYANGVHMSYCLTAFVPWEGYRICFTGDRGRLEHQMVESSYVSGEGTVPGETVHEKTFIRIFPHFAAPYEVPLVTIRGGHGGGDDALLEDIFSENPPPDPLRRAAGLMEGAWSILTGVAANISIERGGLPVNVASLVSGLTEPDWPKVGE
ncbi:MAG: Gfo/Idh/MocA family oxidoreductase [Kiritimatiellae bacterium]|nr:Gfo/Idh/MocA family oxidoreductase [Kiritimatiellia bacterium]